MARKKLNVCLSFNLIKFSIQGNQADCEIAENELRCVTSEGTKHRAHATVQRRLQSRLNS